VFRSPGHRRLNDRLTIRLARSGALLAALSCASSGAGVDGTARPLTFPEALAAEGSVYAPASGFRAMAEPEWARLPSNAGARTVAGSAWRLSDGCRLRFDADADVLAERERVALPTRRLTADECLGRHGFWQQSGGRLFWWMGLASGWSVEYYGELESDSVMALRRYALRSTGTRSWRVDRSSMTPARVHRIPPAVVASAGRPRVADITRALRAVGEADWATRPGAGRTRAVAGTRWTDGGGCVLIFAPDVVARATATQRLTRALRSASCGDLRGSWQQSGSRLFWRVNRDSTVAGETYADVVSDTLMRTRYYELRRDPALGTWQATWVSGDSRVLRRLRR
jgi:hypothetical protein